MNMHSPVRILLCLALFFLKSSLSDETPDQLCNNLDAQQSCGQCIKAHAECAWCIDPHSSLVNRCQLKSKFTNETCTPHLVYSPQTAQVKTQQNLPLETKQHDGRTVVRLQPQAVSVRLMPGHSSTVTFKYLHQTDVNRRGTEPETMEIQTSDVKDSPINLTFYIVCDGELKKTKSCRVQNNQIVEFKIEVTVNSCSNSGDVTLSVGILGQRTIAGIYVTTICGCECEKHPEINSRLCHQNGHLVCGQCVCDPSRGGDKCECPLATLGVSTASELEDKCKFNSSTPVCSSSGKCKCGQCQCNRPTVTGKFCQCDNDSCPLSSNGKVCSGNGVCDCGTCKCEMGWERDDCSCSTASNNCVENGELCSNNGRCECNRCVCNMGNTGAFCGSIEKEQKPMENKPTDDLPETTAASVTETTSTADLPSDEELEKALDDSVKSTEATSSSALKIFWLFYFLVVILFAY
ncbi:hypothetical protein L5515_016176 [Caenorhabditis briggsae]|uniref:Integrin beta epidermal growth factor-like domain-containing protein n=2 Tax=Caenorhabditis briggsae TaxID=6238 RepID=A0AAE9FFB2_CAEBR|nr:hypothetical protein L5515_016176 [Caenorhabditis briggsae]